MKEDFESLSTNVLRNVCIEIVEREDIKQGISVSKPIGKKVFLLSDLLQDNKNNSTFSFNFFKVQKPTLALLISDLNDKLDSLKSKLASYSIHLVISEFPKKDAIDSEPYWWFDAVIVEN